MLFFAITFLLCCILSIEERANRDWSRLNKDALLKQLTTQHSERDGNKVCVPGNYSLNNWD